MPQTLLGLLGLALAAMISFNQQRATSESYQTMVTHELELAASGAMMHAMELIASRSFDEKTTPDGMDAESDFPDGPNDMTRTDNLGSDSGEIGGCNLMRPWLTPACDDVDDLHGITDQSVMLPLAGGDSLEFLVNIEVFYVADSDVETPSNPRTLNKMVRLEARSPALPNRPNNLIEIERVVSYDPVRADAQYESERGYPYDD